MRLLVIKPSSLGDIIHALRVIVSLREQVAELTVDWVVRDRFQPLLALCSQVDHTLIYHRKGGRRAFVRLLSEIRQRGRYDWVWDMQGLARSGCMARAARGDRKWGRGDAREAANLIGGLRPVPLPPGGKEAHAIDLLRGFLKASGLRDTLEGELRFDIEGHLTVNPEVLAQRPILLMPSSRQARKEWPGFSELTASLLQRYPDIPLVWDSHQRLAAGVWQDHANFYNWTGQTSLADMIALIKAARLVVVGDSGPLHLASAWDKPLVALFGPTSPNRFGPWPADERSIVVQAPADDLRDLAVEPVLEATKRLLSRQA